MFDNEGHWIDDPLDGWMYHELKADELLKFGKIIDKKIKEL